MRPNPDEFNLMEASVSDLSSPSHLTLLLNVNVPIAFYWQHISMVTTLWLLAHDFIEFYVISPLLTKTTKINIEAWDDFMTQLMF